VGLAVIRAVVTGTVSMLEATGGDGERLVEIGRVIDRLAQ
jgi:hypothetical protein